MMTSSLSTNTGPIAGALQDTGCSAKAEQRGHSVAIARMMGMETAADLLGGKPVLASVLKLSDRALRYKLTGDRGVSDSELVTTADALDAKAAKIAAHARKLRDEAQA